MNTEHLLLPRSTNPSPEFRLRSKQETDMHRLLERLSRDHVNLERILDLLSLQLDHFCAGRESNFDLKCELLEYIETYADQGHHPLET